MSGPNEWRGDGGRRNRWRSSVAPPGPRPGGRGQRRAGWTAASIAALVGLAALAVWPWLFARRTAVVQLSIDEYQNDLVAPLPYGREDVAAIGAALAGRLAPQLEGRAPKTLEYHTASGLSSQLRGGVGGLRLTGRDALVAVVRGQMLVAPDAAEAQRACLLAEDVGLSRAVPTNIVPCGELVEAFASSPARTTLVVLDMGDLRWDPRLGVIAGLVPAQIDEEVGRWAAAGECWVLGSHDTHEFSGVSIVDRRGIFLRAVEEALAGRADDRQWGGDGDGEVELHELARFVTAWTNAWSRQESGFDQRPVLWKAGVGRVPLDGVPRGIRLVAAGRPQDASPTVTAGFGAARADEPAAPATAVPADDAAAESPAAAPEPGETPPVPEPEPRLWELVARAEAAGDCRPLDYAPHLWRKTVAVAAATAATPRDESPLATRFARLERKIETDLQSFLRDAGQPLYDEGLPLARLARSRQRAATGFAIAWRNGDEHVRAALAGRNRAFELAAAAVDYCAAADGSQISRSVARPVGPVIDAVAAVHAELARLAAATGPGESPDELVRRLRDLEEAERRLRLEVDEAGDRLIDRVARERHALLTADVRWFTAARLPTADQRRRLAAAVAAREREYRPAAAADAAAGDPPAAVPRRLELRLPLPPVPEAAAAGLRPGRPDARWEDVEERLSLAARLLTAFGRSASELPDPVASVAALRQASGNAGSPSRPAAAARAGQALAASLAGLPARVESLLAAAPGAAAAGGGAAAIDALLRLCDPRDADRMPAAALGWPPTVRVALPLRLAIKTPAAPLDAGASRRVAVALQSGAPLPVDGTLTLEFDPDRLEIRLPGGTELVSGKPLAVQTLADRAQLVVLVRPRRQLAAGDPERTAPLVAELAVGRNRDRGEHRFQLPIMERIEVAVRGRSGTVEGEVERADGWWTLAVDPLAAGDAAEAEPGRPGSLRLRPFPGQVTGWELALANQTGEQRAVDVALISVRAGSGEPTGDDPGWRAFATALARRVPPPATARVLASSGPVVLPAEANRVAVFLHPPSRPAAAGAATQEGAPPAIGVDSTVAIVIRDLSAEPAPAAAGGPADEQKPLVRPPERQRTWVVRLDLSPRRPSSYLAAQVVWSAEERSLAIEVEPSGGGAAFLPDGGVRIRAAALERATAASEKLLRLSKREATLTAVNPKGSLTANWNGEDDVPVGIALEVDGYPRAFVLRADCRPVMSGVPQRPQRDWRQLEFLEPEDDFRPFKPDDEVPVRLAVDLPEDMLGGGAKPIELLLAERRQEEAAADGGAPPVWAGASDRHVDYLLADASPPAAFAVRANVGDWSIPVRAPGFSDVDVVLEARLRLRDEPKPVVARRTIVFDGSPPEVDVPRGVRAERGKDAVIAVACDDGGGVRSGGRRAGASGVAWVEWRIDAGPAGEGEPWQQIRAAEAVRIRVPTAGLAVGRHAVRVRAIDHVGLKSPARECELEVVEPPEPGDGQGPPAGPS